MTYGPSQNGCAIAQLSPAFLQIACAPSAHFEKCAQHPSAAQPHVLGSKNTEWQLVRASQAAAVVAVEHGPLASTKPASSCGHAMPGQPPGLHIPVPGVHPGHQI